MSCLINENNVIKELEFLKDNNSIKLIQLNDSNVKIFYDLKIKNSDFSYLKFLFTKNLKNDNSFTIEILENNLNESIEIQNFIETFLQNFHWEKDMVHLNDFFEK